MQFYNKKIPSITRQDFLLVGEAGLEPARPEWTLEPESSESANSTTRPCADCSDNIAHQNAIVNHFFQNLQNFFVALGKSRFPTDERLSKRLRDSAAFGVPATVR